MSEIFSVVNPLRTWKKGDLPADPTVTIVFNEIFTNEEGRITISATLAADCEIDHAIDAVQKDLESVRKEAKRVLKTQNEKIRCGVGILNSEK